jgi:predicted transcriptional regulator
MDHLMTDTEATLSRVEMTAEIVSAYVEHNSIPASELPALIKSVHDSLGMITGEAKPEVVAEPLQPKVPIKKSVTNDFIVCLEDGRRFKSLKRHLHSEHGLSPDEYRSKWGLNKDYPMVAPAYADARSNLAKTIGLGRKSAPMAMAEPVKPAEPVDEPVLEAPAKKAPVRRKAKVA